jgi:hypothetical protein
MNNNQTQEKLNYIFASPHFYIIKEETDTSVKIRTQLSFSHKDISEIEKQGLIFKVLTPCNNGELEIYFEKSK